MNTVDSLTAAIGALRSRRNETHRLLDHQGRATPAQRKTWDGMQARVSSADDALATLEALRDLLRVSTELGTADAAAIRRSMQEDLVR